MFGYIYETQLKTISDSSLEFQSLSRLRLTARFEWQRETRKILYSEDVINKSAQLSVLFNRLAQKQDEKNARINAANKTQLTNVIVELLMTLEAVCFE